MDHSFSDARNATPGADGAAGAAAPGASPVGASAESNIDQLQQLLHDLNDVTTQTSAVAEAQQQFDDRMANVRLGVAASLFAALRCKHQPTAAHSLRVALGCSTWALAKNLPEEAVDQLEVAALLHDIGKVGVPDTLLAKPAKLTTEEAAIMNRHRRMGLYILLSCCESTDVLQLVGNAPAWFDGSSPGYELAGPALPLGARMLAIVDAFDSMTTDHVYRRALPRERALAELYRYAGTQFDPDLVQEFAQLQLADLAGLRAAVGRRWLESLQQQESNRFWSFQSEVAAAPEIDPFAEFHKKMLENMHDGIVFVDVNSQVLMWNRGIERLTGVAESAALHRAFSTEWIRFRDEQGKPLPPHDCPVAYAIQSGMQLIRRLSLVGRTGKPIPVNVHAIPVTAPDGTMFGATLVLHDASPETTLEERCQVLHEKATKDPLTQVANRAEFNRTHELFVQVHLEQQLPCSLIITDIDHFKRINDTYGHPAGDEVLKVFAQILKTSCRPGDLVARYGGEEFCVLCADCNSSAAARRAEELRAQIAARAMDALSGTSITASFGVTEVQPGDTTATMLNRADRALFQAKEFGRNRVVQLGDGIGTEKPRKRSWWSWFQRDTSTAEALVERTLSTPVPLKVLVEKLRGFVADHEADLQSIDKNDIVLHVERDAGGANRRRSDAFAPLLVELKFQEQLSDRLTKTGTTAQMAETLVKITIRPKRPRDRRRGDATEQAQSLFRSLQSYLMATELADHLASGAGGAISTWLGGKPDA